ncbi:unnamed protein product [Ceutorhynchus assimilis]|uniref:Uncharacterized protein n=1 Tax=Ceutorhynchus assimilis TaxID=467358 RepID=A0A9N9MTJ8_9CUCU|nr:unnamed protein product [Ceutorhynchus assimilis]
MARRWKPEEIAFLREKLQQNNEVLLKEDLQALEQQIPGRSLAGIKKTYLELKHQQHDTAAEIGPEPQTAPTGSKLWSEEEELTLVSLYKQQAGSQSGAKIKAILNNFLGRTTKVIATKLRGKYPNIYYMRYTSDDEAEEHQNNDENLPENQNLAQAPSSTPPPQPEPPAPPEQLIQHHEIPVQPPNNKTTMKTHHRAKI